MIRFILFLLLNGFAVWLASEWLPGVSVEGYWTAVLVGLVLGLVNAFVRPLLVLITLPISIATFGLFLFVIHGSMVLLADWLVPGFTVDGFGWAILFTLLLVLINFLIGKVASPPRSRKGS